MTTFTQEIQETFRVVACYTCGVRFGINTNLYRRVVEKAEGSVYCPSCGKGTCWRESAEKRRIRELEASLTRERQVLDQTKAELRETEARRRAEKGAKTRIKNRVANGVCPCCNRTFQDLQKHMKTKHPEFAADVDESGKER